MSPTRRLIDLPGVKDLEYQALLNREFTDAEARARHPEIDACATALFGLTPDQADAHPRPKDWDGIEDRSPAAQAAAAEAEGWDLTDDKRRPLRTLAHLSAPFWLALRSVAGALPFTPEAPIDPDADWAGALKADAKAWRKR